MDLQLQQERDEVNEMEEIVSAALHGEQGSFQTSDWMEHSKIMRRSLAALANNRAAITRQCDNFFADHVFPSFLRANYHFLSFLQ
jgi:hypothetical protein